MPLTAVLLTLAEYFAILIRQDGTRHLRLYRLSATGVGRIMPVPIDISHENGNPEGGFCLSIHPQGDGLIEDYWFSFPRIFPGSRVRPTVIFQVGS